MKYIYVLVLTICLSFNSCVSQNQLEIELVNKEIYFIELNSENEQYKNDKERELSYNLIKVNLRNVSGKKILLFINPNKFGFYSEGFYPENIKYVEYGHLIESDDKTKTVSGVLSNFTEYPVGLNNKEDYEYDLRQTKYKSIGIAKSEEKAYNLYEQHSLTLGINETKTLYFSLTLPIIEETNWKILQNPVRYNKLEEGWNFKIVYQALADNIYKDLPGFVKEELKKNDIEIFNGIVYSNSVKLKKR